METRFDIVIVGAGPAGLCLAAALTSRLRVAVVDREPLGNLSDPAFDGREIALNHASVQALRELDLWTRIPADDVSQIRDVRVFNGLSRRFMHLDHIDGGATELGYLVSNHLIRRAAYEGVRQKDGVTIMPHLCALDVACGPGAVNVELSDGRALSASLLVAADSRFSAVRSKVGIAARSRDFGKTMLVCRMEHERPHGQIASEWFDYGQTLALLPLSGNRSSAVITLADNEARALQQLEPRHFDFEVERRYRGRMGWMRRISEVFAYPLVTVMADRFAGTRCALVGDAAVGMHPVTAHGFNLGLLGAVRLAREIGRAASDGRDIGAHDVLTAYARSHLRATLPLYFGTNALVGLYTNDNLPARLVRGALIRLGSEVRPFKRALATSLTRPRAPASVLPVVGSAT